MSPAPQEWSAMSRSCSKSCSAVPRQVSTDVYLSKGRMLVTYVSHLDEELDERCALLDVVFVQDAFRNPASNDSAETRNCPYIEWRFRSVLSALQDLLWLDCAEKVGLHNGKLTRQFE